MKSCAHVCVRPNEVYDFAHIGNARPLIVFDVLFRLLRHALRRRACELCPQRTDVDDKINARAGPARHLDPGGYRKTAAHSMRCDAAIGCLPPSVEPRATEHIVEMISLVERLIARGHAYAAEGHVLFDVASDPDYGSLARRSLDEMRAGARVEVAPYKRDPMDFVLWKPQRKRTRLGKPLGLRKARLAPRMLGDVGEYLGQTSTFTAAASTSSSRTTRTRWRNRPARTAPRSWPTSGCTTGLFR